MMHFIRSGVVAVLFTLITSTAFAELLPNGGSLQRSITAAGQIHNYEFDASAGDRFWLRVSDTVAAGGPLTPRLYVYRPDGTALTNTWGYITANVVSYTVPVTGQYSVQVKDYDGVQTGPYEIFFSKAGGANEHGALPVSGYVDQSFSLGDIDSYTFYGVAGNDIALHVSTTGDPALGTDVVPRFYVYRPDGVVLDSAWDYLTAQTFNTNLPQTGMYTVIVADYDGVNTGPYRLHFAMSPGANELGSLPNGGSIDDSFGLGDIDSFTFTGQTGNLVTLTLADIGDGTATGDITPRFYIYRPDGVLLTSAWDYITAQVNNVQLPLTGVYTVIAASYYGEKVGPYRISFNCPNGCVGLQPPPAPVLASPDGVVNDTTPSFTWYPSATATWYYLWVDDERGTVHTQWYTSADAGCSAGGVCSISPNVSPYGASRFWVQAWNTAGYGPWSAGKSFYALTSTPAAAQLVAPSGAGAGATPVFQWQPVNYANWYEIWISDATGVVHNQWYQASSVGCHGGQVNCTLTSPVSISGSAVWWVRTWNPLGYGPWSAGMSFTP